MGRFKTHDWQRLLGSLKTTHLLDCCTRCTRNIITLLATQMKQPYCSPWISQYVKKVLHKWITCRKVSGKPYIAPAPPPLPKIILTEGTPVTVSGVDFAGPLYVKDKKGNKRKVFLCLFTCASTHAVHLEVVPDLSDESCIQSFIKLISRKSLPRTIILNNASTYLTAVDKI